jgi:hypothetical protein
LKGVTKNIEFPARITVSGNTAEAIAKFNIDRKEWGLFIRANRMILSGMRSILAFLLKRRNKIEVE